MNHNGTLSGPVSPSQQSVMDDFAEALEVAYDQDDLHCRFCADEWIDFRMEEIRYAPPEDDTMVMHYMRILYGLVRP